MSQEIKYLKVADLVLWTENPRDPISSDAKDQDIVDRALSNSDGTWDINKLAKSMGKFYDFSELPTVVYEDGKPIVYDGNRRVIIGKIYHRYVTSPVEIDGMPEFPEEIPCNVCDKDTALHSVLRKHGESGSWKPLERDVFVDKYKLGDKSDFLIMEEDMGLISGNPILNQGFVKKEIFNQSTLEKLGLKIENGVLLTQHSKDELKTIFDDIIDKINRKIITTRTSRGKAYDILEQSTKDIIDNNKSHTFARTPKIYSQDSKRTKENERDGVPVTPQANRKTKRVQGSEIPFFGKDLCLKAGKVNNLYRDILDLHRFYKSQKLSKSFCVILRMSLRFLCEMASALQDSSGIKPYIERYFDEAKKTIDHNQATLLASQNVKKETLTQLLQTGAHGYCSSENYEQTLAISIILGAMLTISHGRKS